MIPYYILAIEDETDRAYMTALFFQYQKLMYSTIQKVTNDHWLIDDIFQTSFEHLIGKIDLLKDLDRNRLVNYLIVTCRNTAYNMCRSYSAHITLSAGEIHRPFYFLSIRENKERLSICRYSKYLNIL